jgi:hypothetical protein
VVSLFLGDRPWNIFECRKLILTFLFSWFIHCSLEFFFLLGFLLSDTKHPSTKLLRAAMWIQADDVFIVFDVMNEQLMNIFSTSWPTHISLIPAKCLKLPYLWRLGPYATWETFWRRILGKYQVMQDMQDVLIRIFRKGHTNWQIY